MITVEWEFCPSCGEAVTYRDGIAVVVVVHGEYGRGQVDTDVEHECEES